MTISEHRQTVALRVTRVCQVAARGARILSRLHVYEAVAKFQVAAEEAVRGHAEGTETPLRHIHATCSQAGAALQGLSHALLACPAQQRSNRPAAVGALGPEGWLLSITGQDQCQCLQH
jgi:hypothetical protein